MGSEEPLVSIVIPVYNSVPFLVETMGDLRNQTYSNIEIICVDDGSSDGGGKLLDEFARLDDRITVVHQENSGTSKARNLGIDLCHGEYLLIVDADDRFERRFVDAMVTAMRLRHADLVVCDSIAFDSNTGERMRAAASVVWRLLPGNDVIAPQSASKVLFRAFMGWPWDKMYRMEFIREQGLSFPDLANSEDLVFVYAALAAAERIALVKEILVEHRMNIASQRSSSRTSAPTAFYDAICLLKEELEVRGIYETFEYGFLNWALDYTQWNIKTLPFGEARREALSRLFEGGYPALEVEERGIGYFNLYPRAEYNLELLRREYGGKPNSRPFFLGVKSLFRK